MRFSAAILTAGLLFGGGWGEPASAFDCGKFWKKRTPSAPVETPAVADADYAAMALQAKELEVEAFEGFLKERGLNHAQTVKLLETMAGGPEGKNMHAIPLTYLLRLRLTVAEQLSIVKQLPIGYGVPAEIFNILDAQEGLLSSGVRLELMRKCVRHFGLPMLTLRFRIEKEEDRFELFKAWLPLHPDRALQGMQHFKLSDAHRTEGYQLSMVQDFERTLNFLIPGGQGAHHSIEDFKNLLLSINESIPGLFPKKWVELAWDKVQDRNVGVKILTILTRLERRNGRAAYANTLEVLSDALGIPALKKLDLSKISTNRCKELYEVLLDLQDMNERPAFESIDIDEAFFTQQKKGLDGLLPILYIIRDDYRLTLGTAELEKTLFDRQAVWDQILSELLGAERFVSWEKRAEFAQFVESRLTSKLNALFRMSGGGFTYEEFKMLSSRWGDLEPVQTLLSRFAGRQDWIKEISVLVEVFGAELKNEFKKLKFSGNPKSASDRELARAQLKFLSDAAKVEWARARQKLSLMDPNDASLFTEEQVWKQRWELASNQMQNTLLPHLTEFSSSSAVPLQSYRDRLGLLRATSLSAKDRAQALKSVLSDLEKELAQAGSAGTTLMQDVDALVKILNATPKMGKEGVILTALNSDAKLLLTIGDAVKTNSCQNYKTGFMIQTLLGYVKDANVQAVVSYPIAKESFSAADWIWVKAALQDNRPLKVVFDGNRKVVLIANADGSHRVVVKAIGDAFLRQMIKVGADDAGNVGVRLEPPYAQEHPFMGVMRTNHEDLRREVSRAIGADPDFSGEVTSQKSRNPGGVYSDLAGGSKTDNYILPAYR